MKTTTKIFSGMAVFVLALATIGSVSADSIDSVSFGAGIGNGYGDDEDREDGLLADYMEAAIAEGLGLTVEELNAMEAEGKTHYDIAFDLDFSAEEFETILQNARDRAIELAEEDGVILQLFGENGKRNGQFGSEMDQDWQLYFGNDVDGEQRGGLGGRMMNAKDCEGDICSEEPLGEGRGRAMEDVDGSGYGRGMMNETCDDDTCSEEPAGMGMGRGGRR